MKERWSAARAWEWYRAKPWIMGVNYVPAITVHGIELWQEDTGPEVMGHVRRELDLMQSIGINSVRMGLPFGVWYHDREKFLDRVDMFLQELDRRGISMMPVIFNDCVSMGKPEQIEPPLPRGWRAYTIGHHGGAVDNPFTGNRERIGWIYWDEEDWRPVMEEYLRVLLERFGKDGRIYAWDLWNEPGNGNRGDKSLSYLQRVFVLARDLDPVQPLTAGAWNFPQAFAVDAPGDVSAIERCALDESDILTFHWYGNIESMRRIVARLKQEGRPLLNTEWLNRILDNFVQDDLPLFHDEGIGSYSWGLVAGKSQHFLPWDELWKRRDLPLMRWQHDLFDPWHTLYDESDIALMKALSPRSFYDPVQFS